MESLPLDAAIDIFDQKYYGNTLRQYLLAGAVTLGIILVTYLIRGVLASRLQGIAARTATKADDLLLSVLRQTRMLLTVLVGVYLGSLLLDLPERLEWLLPLLATVAVFLQIGLWGANFVKLSAENYRETKRTTGDVNSLPVIGVMSILGRVVLWAVVFLLILDNFGVDVTALVAGLGIGGIAIALAVQNILSDLLASISIMLDKPFEVGDFIIVGDMLGTVETIGVKTTRVRSLGGERLVFPNSDLLNSRIRNYRHMQERRIQIGLGVIYQTPAEQVAAIPNLIKEAIDEQDMARFDRAHFKAYGDFSLNYEAIFYVLSPEYNVYMDVQQGILLGILHRFQERGIEFAYPTRTLYMQSLDEDKAPRTTVR